MEAVTKKLTWAGVRSRMVLQSQRSVIIVGAKLGLKERNFVRGRDNAIKVREQES